MGDYNNKPSNYYGIIAMNRLRKLSGDELPTFIYNVRDGYLSFYNMEKDDVKNIPGIVYFKRMIRNFPIVACEEEYDNVNMNLAKKILKSCGIKADNVKFSGKILNPKVCCVASVSLPMFEYDNQFTEQFSENGEGYSIEMYKKGEKLAEIAVGYKPLTVSVNYGGNKTTYVHSGTSSGDNVSFFEVYYDGNFIVVDLGKIKVPIIKPERVVGYPEIEKKTEKIEAVADVKYELKY